ncbi:hypothetical protein CTAYLR_006944 [Chrysophaeum taylorii]|uniref:VWFA domain-containing protein n=1 Tax=Chrysophaeum taylorii TaxID=2483200 RepID=A0AAD7XPA1_9STRA|nr:hypothetical protein CTAYLR_006944 [Chrysophaeum taylorii]
MDRAGSLALGTPTDMKGAPPPIEEGEVTAVVTHPQAEEPPVATALAEVVDATPEPTSNHQSEVVTAPIVNTAGGYDASNEDVNVDLSERLATMKETLGLPDPYVADLLKLVGTDIVVIADDSGSMNAITDPRKITEPVTRWEELQQTLRMLVTMLLVVEHVEGFWLKFLNDPEWYKITDKDQLERIFAAKPRAHGKTPLKANLEPIMQGYGSEEKDTLLLILTDGEPSDCSFEELSQIVRSKRHDVFCSFAMCTDEGDVVERYNQVVDPIPGCDITDDYASERTEAIRFGNKLTPYQWLAKMLLVKFPKYDHLDEKRLNHRPCCLLS